MYIDIVGDNEDVSQDRLTIEWGNAPDPTKRPNATFKHDWFMGRAKTRHEVIKIAYDSVQTD